MRTLLTLLLGLGLVGLLVTPAAAYTVVFEAEDYTWIKPSMEVVADGDASGGKCVQVPLRAERGDTEQPPTDDGNVTLKGWAPLEATYYLWARVKWYDGCGNSLFLFVDDMNPKTPLVIGNNATYGRWHWVLARKNFKLTKGWHVFRFQNREDGARLDQFLITTVPPEDWTPQGIRPPTKGYVWHPE